MIGLLFSMLCTAWHVPVALAYATPLPRHTLSRGGLQTIVAVESAPPRDSAGSRPRLQNEDRYEPSFADPSRRIARTISDMALPVRTELLRSRLALAAPEYAPPKPPSVDAVNTPHTLSVVVGALLALTDGKLDDMLAAADPDSVSRLNDAEIAARALGGNGQGE